MKPLLLFLLLWPATGLAQPTLSPEAEVSLVTVYPGRALYSAYGHTAFRVRDPAQNIDVTYNYGTFDFEAQGFYLKFLRGQLDYVLSRPPTAPAFRLYEQRERSIVEQVLNLSAAQQADLFAALETNYLPENRAYRYDFFFDNCSTRPRDVLKATLGSALRFGDPAPPQTFRQLLAPYLQSRSWLTFGINLILGAPVDRTATQQETWFLPLHLMEAMDEAQVLRGETRVPLVARTDTVYWADPTFWQTASFPWPLLCLGLLALGLVGWTLWAMRKGRALPRMVDGFLFGAAGAMGLLMAFLWLGTEHVVTGPNWNLLWAWPTHVVAAGLLGWKRPPTGLRYYWLATAIVTGIAGVGWAAWPQVLPTAALPLVLLLAVRAAHLFTVPPLPAPT